MRQILICGGRDYCFCAEDYALLDGLHAQHVFTEVVHGGSAGADQGGDTWAVSRHIPTIKRFPADWTSFARMAGPIRNTEMAQYVNDDCIVVAFPGGSGTADMVRKAIRRGLEVRYA